MPLAVILTALPVEYLAVRRYLSNHSEEKNRQGKIYERGQFEANGCSWEIGIAEIGIGNTNAAVEAERAIAHFNPEILMFVGIAGGLRDVEVGDVIAANKVYGYEAGKDEGHFSTRPVVWSSSYSLTEQASAEARKKDWLKRISSPLLKQPKVFVKPIAAGEKILASKQSNTFTLLRKRYNDAIGVAMEEVGFLNAAFSYPSIETIVIRGVSDLIDGKNDDISESEEERQKRACEHAAAFAFEIISKVHQNRFLINKKSCRTKILDDNYLPIYNYNIIVPTSYNLKDLEKKLSQSQWKTADKITYKILLDNIGQENEGWIIPAEIINIPCKLIQEIDFLWRSQSQSKFGLSIQYQIWILEGGKPEKFDNKIFRKFIKRVGWEKEDRWLQCYDDFTFDLGAPKGHLPSLCFVSNGVQPNWQGLWKRNFQEFLAHIHRCFT